MSIGDQILQEKFEGQNVIPDAWWLFIFLRPRMNAPGIDSQSNCFSIYISSFAVLTNISGASGVSFITNVLFFKRCVTINVLVLFFKLLETRIDGNRNGLEVVRKR
jgi:hypothetical protein